jgi:hypothetical protein
MAPLASPNAARKIEAPQQLRGFGLELLPAGPAEHPRAQCPARNGKKHQHGYEHRNRAHHPAGAALGGKHPRPENIERVRVETR